MVRRVVEIRLLGSLRQVSVKAFGPVLVIVLLRTMENGDKGIHGLIIGSRILTEARPLSCFGENQHVGLVYRNNV